MPEPFRHRLRVRYGECDAQGAAFNANYLSWFDVALTELWRAAVPGGYAAMVAAGTDMVVAEAGVRYLAPARFDDEIELEITPVRLGTTAMSTELAVLRGHEHLAEGSMRHVFVDRAGAKAPIPPSVRAALEPYLREHR